VKEGSRVVQTVFFWPPTSSAAEFPCGSDRLNSLQPWGGSSPLCLKYN